MKRQNFQSNRHATKQAFKPSFAHSVADNSFLSIEELSAITRLPKAEIVGLHLAGLVPGFKSFVDEGL